jgi:hypothetical protein
MNRLDWLGDLAPYLPPALGALIGLRWAREQSPTQKVVSFGLSFGLGVYFGPAVAELLSLGPKAAVAAGILIAVIGMDVIGGLLALAAAFRSDPIGTFRAWWGAWWTRGNGP